LNERNRGREGLVVLRGVSDVVWEKTKFMQLPPCFFTGWKILCDDLKARYLEVIEIGGMSESELKV